MSKQGSTSGKVVPSTAADWTSLLKAVGVTGKAVHVWTCPFGKLGDETAYADDVPGWTRKP